MKLNSSQTRLRRAASSAGRRQHSSDHGNPDRSSRRSGGAEYGAMNHAIRCREADDEIRDLLARY
jgi:hypothetical protein